MFTRIEFILKIYRNSVRTLQETHYVSAIDIGVLILITGKNSAYCENHTKHKNTLYGQNAEFYYFKAGGTYRIAAL
jgi:hypothetical protein